MSRFKCFITGGHDFEIMSIWNFIDKRFGFNAPSHQITYKCKNCNHVKIKVNYMGGYLYIVGVRQGGIQKND